MKIITKDILTVENGIICQQVNCQGVMGGGLAKQIRNKWPIVYEIYIEYCQRFKNDFELLGQAQFIPFDNKLDYGVCNIFGQLNYGTHSTRYTDYGALKEAFKYAPCLSMARESKEDVYFPYLFGCGLANGDWDIVSKMIDFYFPDATICKLP